MKSGFLKLAMLALFIIVVVLGVVRVTKYSGKTKGVKSELVSEEKLNNLYSRIDVNKRIQTKTDPKFVFVDSTEAQEEILPDISEYPVLVNATTSNFITIMASQEKNNWLKTVAEQFNKDNSVSVSVRSIPSNDGINFITSESNSVIPDVYAPSSDLYGELLIGKNVPVKLIGHTAKNVSGIILSQKKKDDLIKKYKNIDEKTIISAVVNGDILVSYVDPKKDEDGFNFIITVLPTDDPDMLRQFQDNIPFIAYNADQLEKCLINGTLDAIISNNHSFVTQSRFKSYTFIPFGLRRDNPFYEVALEDTLKKSIAKKFVDFLNSDASQKIATEAGFNRNNDYANAIKISGVEAAQRFINFQKEKNGSSDLTAVFVADISGSMEGAPLLAVKGALNQLIETINSNVNIGFVTFSDRPNIILPIDKFDIEQRKLFSQSVKELKASGGTAMYDAIIVAQKMLVDAKKRNPKSRLIMFVLTDGESNRGHSLGDVKDMTAGLRIPIYTIGYNGNFEVLKTLSDINEAVSINAETDNVINRLNGLLNSQM